MCGHIQQETGMPHSIALPFILLHRCCCFLFFNKVCDNPASSKCVSPIFQQHLLLWSLCHISVSLEIF